MDFQSKQRDYSRHDAERSCNRPYNFNREYEDHRRPRDPYTSSRKRSRSRSRSRSARSRSPSSRNRSRHDRRGEHRTSSREHKSRSQHSPSHDAREGSGGRYQQDSRHCLKHNKEQQQQKQLHGKKHSEERSGRLPHASEDETLKPNRWTKMEKESQEDREAAPAPAGRPPSQPQTAPHKPAATAGGGDAGNDSIQAAVAAAAAAAAAAKAAALPVVSPGDSAELVRRMMQGSAATAGTSALSREQKAKLLWGHKKDAAAAGVVPAAGNNRWEQAEFTDSQQRVRFQKLMGAHHYQQQQQQQAPSSGPSSGSSLQQQQQLYELGVEASAPKVMDREQQAKVLSDVERQFIQGLRRADGRTVGLGL